MEAILSSVPWLGMVLSGLGSLVVLAQVVVALTPSKKDDELLDKLEGNSLAKKALEWLKSMALIQKK